MFKILNKEVDSGEPKMFAWICFLGLHSKTMWNEKDIVGNYKVMFESRISAGGTEKLPYPNNFRISSWSYDMEGHSKKSVERNCELANSRTQQLCKVSTPCIDGLLKCLYLTRTWKTWFFYGQRDGVPHTRRGGRMNQHPAVVPSRRRGKKWDAKEEEPGCPQGKVAATWHGDDSPHLSWKCAQVTGKAGENGQHSGEMDGSSAWTRPSAPVCGDTQKGLAGDQRPIQGGDRPRKRLRGRYRLGHRPVELFRTEKARCTVRPTWRVESVLRPVTRALPSVIVIVIVDTEKVLQEADGQADGSVELVVVKRRDNGKVFAPRCAWKAGLVSRWGAEEHNKRT